MGNIRIYYLVIYLTLLLTSFLSASDTEYLNKRWEKLQKERALKGAVPPPKVSIPNPHPSNPEYLIRTVFVIPSDRIPSDQSEYDEKVHAAVAKIQASLQAVNDFYVLEMERLGIENPGKPLNFERDANGDYVVHVINSARPLKGPNSFWGDTTGLDWGGNYYRATEEIFYTGEERLAATEKTVWLIFPDIMEIDGSEPSTTLRGYVGGGASANGSSSGWGGVSVVTWNVTQVFPEFTNNLPQLEQDWIIAICDETTDFSLVDGVTGFYGITPGTGQSRNLKRGEVISIYMGVIAHELTHSFGVVHEYITHDGLMSAGYQRFGAAIIKQYGGEICNNSLDLVNQGSIYNQETQAGLAFCEHVSNVPYAQLFTDPDKTDPKLNISYPPRNTLQLIEARDEVGYPIRFSATDEDTGINHTLLYRDGNLKDFNLTANGDQQELIHYIPQSFDAQHGKMTIDLTTVDAAGNHTFATFGLPVFESHSTYNRQITNRTNHVRTADDGIRNLMNPIGSYNNAYVSLSDAVNAANALEGGAPATIIVWPGVHTISSPLKVFGGMTLIGAVPGESIIDGAGGDFALIEGKDGDSPPTEFYDLQISGLVFRNARAGINRNIFGWAGGIEVTNNIFHDLDEIAIEMVWLTGRTIVAHNTISNCGEGIVVCCYNRLSTPNAHFSIHNNIAINCTGRGIWLSGIGDLFSEAPNSDLQSGYNLVWNCSPNYSGSGDDMISYETKRLPGENATNPFLGNDFRPLPGSPALRSGVPFLENQDGSVRDRGALINNILASDLWMLQ